MIGFIYLNPREKAQFGDYFEGAGYEVVITQPIPKGGTSDDLMARLNAGLR